MPDLWHDVRDNERANRSSSRGTTPHPAVSELPTEAQATLYCVWAEIAGEEIVSADTFTNRLHEHGIALRHEREGTQRLACPQCDKGPRDEALAVTVEHGGAVWLCHRCGFKGGARDRRESIVRPPPRRAERDNRLYATSLWLAAHFDDAIVRSHPYSVKKGITWAGGAGRGIASGKLIGQHADCIMVPIRTDAIGRLQGVQCINVDGVKQSFGVVNGGCLVLGNTLNKNLLWYVAEGWASAFSVVFHHHRGNAVCAVAFGKHNLMSAAEILARMFSSDEVTVLQEQDQ